MTPMILGLALMLLLLVAGVTAVGSAFLARQDVQHVCDGAAAVAGDAVAGGNGDPVAIATRWRSRPGPHRNIWHDPSGVRCGSRSPCGSRAALRTWPAPEGRR